MPITLLLAHPDLKTQRHLCRHYSSDHFIGLQCTQIYIFFFFISELGRRTGQNPVPELKLIEFKAETYNGLVRLLRPGCRTIILICDIDSKNALVSKFFKIMWPYRRNKTLNFGFMFIEKVCKIWFLIVKYSQTWQ